MKPAKSIDLQAHLERSLRKLWKDFRKRLRRCRGAVSEKAVHELRVVTRRLLSKLDLLEHLAATGEAGAVCRRLKKFLDAFDPLRDTQVQALAIHAQLRRYPELDRFQRWLIRREARLAKRAGREIQRARVAGLKEAVATIRKRIRSGAAGARLGAGPISAVHRGVDRAFRRVTTLARRIDPRDTATIHRTRVAFKKFRYQIESLQALLRGVTRRQRLRMHDYQTGMGRIQDIEVLIGTLDRYVRRKRGQAAALRRFRQYLLRRRTALINAYLEVADDLHQFWPLPADQARAAARKK